MSVGFPFPNTLFHANIFYLLVNHNSVTQPRAEQQIGQNEHWVPITNLSKAMGGATCHHGNPKAPLVTPACCWGA